MSIPNSARISASKVSTQPFANLYNLINNRSNVPDPNDVSGNRKFVHVRMPNFSRNFHGFPFVIVRNVSPNKKGNTADLSKVYRDYNSMIEVYSQDKDGDSSGNPNGAETRNNIVDSIINTLDNPTNRKLFLTYGMANLEYDVHIDDDEELNEKATFGAEFSIRFENNLMRTS